MRGATFPLKKAYPFLHHHGLGRQADTIKWMSIRQWDLSYTSSVRRGFVIQLMKSRGLLEQFIDRYWPQGRTDDGKKEIALRLSITERYEAETGHTPWS